ncbi:MAG: response regulator [Chloroflexi bacterium]|nr:response regulator [Chloroflexota bacterium]
MKRVLLVEELAQVAGHLRGLLVRDADVQVIGVEADLDVAAARAATEHPDVIFIDALLQAKGRTDAFSLAKRVRASSPATRIVMITVPQRPLSPRLEDAIDAVFVRPGGANERGVALGPWPKERGGKGQVIVIYSPKGGTGKTTIAVNVACTLRREGRTVALMDGVMQFGALRHVLAVPTGARSIVDLPPGHAMGAALDEVLWEGPAGIRVLLAPERPEQATCSSRRRSATRSASLPRAMTSSSSTRRPGWPTTHSRSSTPRRPSSSSARTWMSWCRTRALRSTLLVRWGIEARSRCSWS